MTTLNLSPEQMGMPRGGKNYSKNLFRCQKVVATG